MFFKTVSPSDWSNLVDQGITHIIPAGSHGFGNNDRINFMQKTAASEKFLHEIGNIKLGDGDIPVHINAIGSTEWSGFNRKGDAFCEQTCKDWHPTFVSEGKLYLHHQNRDPDNNFGKVASSCYNDKMHRIELLVIANGTKEAAARNKGHVLPHEFLSQLEKNAEVPVSMGCYIKNDVCSRCGNVSRTRATYCDETNCIDIKTGEYFFGCKRGLTKVASDGRAQYVENIDPHFFDISFVGVPADRTGYGFRADYIHKTASAIPNPTPVTCVGLDNETGWSMQYKLAMNSMLSKLANYEQVCLNDPTELSNAYGIAALPSDIELGIKLASLTIDGRFRELANLAMQGVLLSPDSFVEAFGLSKTAAVDIHSNSFNVYQQLPVIVQNDDQSLVGFLRKMDSSTKTAAWTNNIQISPQQIQQYKINPNILGTNVMRGVIVAHSQTKHAACYPQGFADTYALYKAAALCKFPQPLQDLGVRYAIWQNSLPRLFERLSG
jgi:hypothetical protein